MSKKLPTLYARTSAGGVQEWTIEISGDKYRTTYGLTDGKKQTTEWMICKPTNVGRSNERDAEAQALFEAQAVWKKRTERGYYENVGDIDKPPFIEPMLAQKYEDRKDEIVFPVYSQPKLDGIRCITTRLGMFSRNGKKIVSAPHIHAELKEFFVQHPDAILDGELYCDKLANDFNKICSLVKKTKPTAADLEESAAKIEYHVYDLIDTSQTFTERYNWVIAHVPTSVKTKVRLVSTALIRLPNDLDEYYAAYLTAGYEGQMVRLDECYEQKRSKYLLKRKEFQDAEYRIVSIHEGEGNRSGMAGYAILENRDGTTFKSNIKGTHEYLKELLEDKDSLANQMATVQYFNLTPDGVPRFPYVIAIRNYE
jgi:DNA ligase-1